MNRPDTGNLDQFIAAFYEEGKLDSAGRFSLDLAGRAAKTALYQLTRPENFVLPLIMAAFEGGAPEISSRSLNQGFALRFGGQGYRSGELLRMLASLRNQAEDCPEPRLRYLVEALRLAMGLQVDTLEFRCESGTLKICGSQVEQSEVGGPGCELCLYHRPGPLGWLLGSRLSKIRTAVENLLSRRCGLGVSWARGETLACLQLGGDPAVSPSGLRGRLEAGALRGSLRLLERGCQSKAVLVVRGVVYRLPVAGEAFGYPYQLVLLGDTFQTDLTYENLVETPELNECLAQVPLWLSELAWNWLVDQVPPEAETSAYPEGWTLIAWAHRQKILHQDQAFPVSWQNRAPECLQLGGGLDLEWADEHYARLRHLPIGNGSPRLLSKPCLRQPLVDLTYPRQLEYELALEGVAPSHAAVGQLLQPGHFWACSEQIGHLQLGLGRQPFEQAPCIWHYRPESGMRVRFSHAEEGQRVGLIGGMTLASLDSPVSPREWLACWRQLWQRAWTDPTLERDRARQAGLLEHWLRARCEESLREELEERLAWSWSTEGERVSLEGSHGSVVISAEAVPWFQRAYPERSFSVRG